MPFVRTPPSLLIQTQPFVLEYCSQKCPEWPQCTDRSRPHYTQKRVVFSNGDFSLTRTSCSSPEQGSCPDGSTEIQERTLASQGSCQTESNACIHKVCGAYENEPTGPNMGLMEPSDATQRTCPESLTSGGAACQPLPSLVPPGSQ